MEIVAKKTTLYNDRVWLSVTGGPKREATVEETPLYNDRVRLAHLVIGLRLPPGGKKASRGAATAGIRPDAAP